MPRLRTINELTNPALLEILRAVDPRGGTAPFSPEEKRTAYIEGVYRAGAPQPVASIQDDKVGSVPVRIYKPSSHANAVLLYLHGGGFLSGNLETHDPVCRALANGSGCDVVAVDYRLSPEHPYPAGLNDCFDVLSWLGSQPRKILVAGDSAGGNLAAALTLMARDRGGPRITAQALIYPVLDATMSSASLIENAFIPPFTLVDYVHMWQLYLPQNADRSDPLVSPLLASDVSGLPPALVVTGGFDILRDEGQRFAARLCCVGTRAESLYLPDMPHGFFQWGGAVEEGRRAVDEVAAFVRRLADE